jgi:hypothetical protein
MAQMGVFPLRLDEETKTALLNCAGNETLTARALARQLLREGLRKRGYLPKAAKAAKAAKQIGEIAA